MLILLVLFAGLGVFAIASPYVILAKCVWVLDAFLVCMLVKDKVKNWLPTIVENETINGIILVLAFIAVVGFIFTKCKVAAIIISIVFTFLYAYQVYIDYGIAWQTFAFAIGSALLHFNAYRRQEYA